MDSIATDIRNEELVYELTLILEVSLKKHIENEDERVLRAGYLAKKLVEYMERGYQIKKWTRD